MVREPNNDASEAGAGLGAGTRTDAPSRASRGVDGDESSKPTGRTVDVEDVLARLADSARTRFTVVGAHIWLFDETTRTMRLVAATGDVVPAPEPVDVDRSSVGEPVRTGKAHLSPPDDSSGLGAWRYTVPVAASGVTGVFALDLLSSCPVADELVEVAAAFRPQVAAALLSHAAQEDRLFAAATLKWACGLVRHVDRDAIVSELLQAALAIGHGEKGSVLLYEAAEEALTIAAADGLTDEIVASTKIVPGDGMAGWVYATGEPLVVEDIDERGSRGRRHGVRSAVVVPIGDEDGALGVINVGSSSFTATFSDSRLSALMALGRAAAVALRNAEALDARQELFLETVRALALALETKDPYSHGATQRVYELAVCVGEKLELSVSEMAALKAGALLHDIGMSAAADDAARRDRPLDTYEWGMLKMHPLIAADVLRQSAALREAVPVVYHHHEHFDGRGYLQGLAGDKIPVGARVLAVADAYVAMTSPRAYRPAMSHEMALAELRANAGRQFDPIVVEAAEAIFGDASLAER